jgi:SAM-dependent methyltransferase
MDDKKSMLVTPITACRVCANPVTPILDFGRMPLANRYLQTVSETELRFPLAVVLCQTCGCVQLSNTVNPKILFADYLYTSSTSGSLSEHFRQYAKDTVEKLQLNPKQDFIVGIGGNDGPLEAAYQKLGFKVLNVEPAGNIAALSRANGVPTVNAWFTEHAARRILEEHGYASLITCNNCFAHMPDIHAVVRAIKILLKPGGWFVCENAYWLDTVRGHHFDQIYHEHCFYWTITALNRLFRMHELSIVDVQFNDNQGGSIMVFVQNGWGQSRPYLQRAIEGEEACGLFKPLTYAKWIRRIDDWKDACQEFIGSLDSICCYGVPAKFTMISEQLRFTPAKIQYAVDDSPIKVGKFTPGSHIPIVDRNHFLEHPTKHCIITATNYADMIMGVNPQYNGTWFVLMPVPTILPTLVYQGCCHT